MISFEILCDCILFLSMWKSPFKNIIHKNTTEKYAVHVQTKRVKNVKSYSEDAKRKTLRILTEINELFLIYGLWCVHSGKKRRQDVRLKKIQNGRQNCQQNQLFENILLGTNLREKIQESKNEQQEKCFKWLYRNSAMLHYFSTRGNFM